jgi:hypothetical protein
MPGICLPSNTEMCELAKNPQAARQASLGATPIVGTEIVFPNSLSIILLVIRWSDDLMCNATVFGLYIFER